MSKLPYWDLSNIFPSVDSKEFNDYVESCTRRTAELTAQLESFKADSVPGGDFEACILGVIREFDEICDMYESVAAYAYASLTVNTTDKKAVAGVNTADQLGVAVMNLNVLFSKFVAANSAAVLPLTGKGGVLEDHAFVLKETIDAASHMMSTEMEDLAADLNRTGCDAFSRLQESVSSVASATIDGKQKTVIELRTMATDFDRKTRKKAYDAEISVWKEHEVAFAAAINGVKGSCLTLEKRRGYDDPLAHAAKNNRISMKVIDALIGTLEKNLPTFHRYWKLKAKALGIRKCAYWDIFAPIGESTKKWSYEETQRFITQQYASFNPEQGAFVKNAFDKHWIDPMPRANKTGGGYDTYFPKVKESRIFCNFNYDYDGVFTISHELGHAWHDHVVSPLSASIRSYPMTLAETASIFGEFIVFQGAVKQAEDKEKKILIETYLQNAAQVCVDILARFYFERELFAHRAEGELVPDELCSLMIDAQKKAFGDSIDPKTLHPYMWAVKGHYYSADASFYNYPYAFGQLFGLGLYKRGQACTDGKPFYETFNKLLSITGQFDAITVAKTGGCDIESPDFWQEGLDIIKSYVDQFEELVNEK